MPSHTATKRAGSISLRGAFSAMLVALVAALLIAAPAQGQAVPQSLEGEMFDTDQVDVTGSNCQGPLGSTFTITYTASGPATGPYMGMFTETGTITAEEGIRFGPIETWNASFTIDSPQGQVKGTKTFIAAVPSAQCIGGTELRFTGADAQLAYTATIRTASGTFSDQGQATAHVLHIFGCDFLGDCVDRSVFDETFTLSTGVLPTNGKATGGGQVVSSSDPSNRVTFGFNVSKTADGSRLQGNCNVLDQATDTHIKCLTVTDYVQIGNTATWEGTASVNGVQRAYRITVQDNGEPNNGADTFSITAGTYQAGGNVQNGNIKIHKQ